MNSSFTKLLAESCYRCTIFTGPQGETASVLGREQQ